MAVTLRRSRLLRRRWHARASSPHRALSLAAVTLGAIAAVCASAAPARADDPYAPGGVQRTLVIFAKYATPHCPIADGTCPASLGTIEAPRHTAKEWQALLTKWVNAYWQPASYGKTSFAIDVLVDADSPDGWFTAPASRQEYLNNGLGYSHDNFNDVTDAKAKPGISYPTRGFVGDVARFAIDRAVKKGWMTAKAAKSYTRLVVFDNVHDRAGQTAGGLLSFTPKSTGALVMSATVNAESFDDFDAISVLMHELGHQLGARAHYGDCTGPYLSPLVSSDAECLGSWDIMGYDSRYPHPTAYTRIDRGWLAPAQTATLPLGPTGFPATVVLAPVERAPAGRPSALRIPVGSSAGAPIFSGYHAECRQRIGGDEGPPGLASALGRLPDQIGVPSEGLLVTSVHEEALAVRLHPVHVVRPGFVNLDDAPLQPGQEVVAAALKLRIRFDGYEPLPGGDRACRVTVTYSPGPWTLVGLFPSAPRPGWAKDTTALSPDVADVPPTYPLPWPNLDPPGPIPMSPPWWGHVNRVAVRVHNWGTTPARRVVVSASSADRVTVPAECGAPPATPAATASVAAAAGQDAIASIPLRAPRGPTAQTNVTVRPPAGQIAAAGEAATNAFSFQYHRITRGRRSAVVSPLWVEADATCQEPATFTLRAATIPRGWQVSISTPHVTVAPGERRKIDVAVRAPAAIRQGTRVQIPINVLQTERLGREPAKRRAPRIAAPTSRSSGA